MCVCVCVSCKHIQTGLSSESVCPSGLLHWSDELYASVEIIWIIPHTFSSCRLSEMCHQNVNMVQSRAKSGCLSQSGAESDDRGMEGWSGANAVINPISSVTPG